MPKFVITFRKSEDTEPMEVVAPANMVQATKSLDGSRFAHIGVVDDSPIALNTDTILSIRQVMEPPEPPTLGSQGERGEDDEY